MSKRDQEDILSFLHRALEGVECAVVMMNSPYQKVALPSKWKIVSEGDSATDIFLHKEIILAAKSEIFDVERGVMDHLCRAITNSVLDLDAQPSYFVVGLHSYTVEVMPSHINFEPKVIGSVKYALASYTEES